MSESTRATYTVHYSCFSNPHFTKIYANVTKAICERYISRYCDFARAKVLKIEVK